MAPRWLLWPLVAQAYLAEATTGAKLEGKATFSSQEVQVPLKNHWPKLDRVPTLHQGLAERTPDFTGLDWVKNESSLGLSGSLF